MVSLAELSSGGDIGAYRTYVIDCAERGKTPLSYQEWVKAGRPKA